MRDWLFIYIVSLLNKAKEMNEKFGEQRFSNLTS